MLIASITFCYLLVMQLFTTGFEISIPDTIGLLWEKYGLLAVVLAVLSPVFIYDSIKLSNRFAGPMISFRTALRALAKGEEIGQLRFRRGDFWPEFANDLNAVAKRLQQLNESSVLASDDDAAEIGRP
jgi:hypothetical protein